MADEFKRGHLAKRTLPEPIPETSETIARAIVNSSPMKPGAWRYLQDTSS